MEDERATDNEYEEYTGAEDERIEDEDPSGAYGWKELLDEEAERVPQEFENPAGVSRGECDAGETQDESCDLEVTALTEDQVLEETKPGIGISGFEGEEVGGG